MKNLARLLAIAVLCAMLGGCAAAIQPATGFVYSDIKGAMTATDNSGFSKVGTSKCTSILGIVATGDASIDAAARSAGISRIHHVDYHTKNILGIYAEHTVYVYGD